MKFLKNNLKVIIGFIVGVILASSITVYAYSYFASDIKYTDDKSVADALNDLYANLNNDYNIPKWQVNSAGNAIAYGFLTLPDLTDYNKLKIDKVEISGGTVQQIALIDSNGNSLQNIPLSNSQQEFNISTLSGTGNKIIAYVSSMSNWGEISFTNISLRK